MLVHLPAAGDPIPRLQYEHRIHFAAVRSLICDVSGDRQRTVGRFAIRISAGFCTQIAGFDTQAAVALLGGPHDAAVALDDAFEFACCDTAVGLDAELAGVAEADPDFVIGLGGVEVRDGVRPDLADLLTGVCGQTRGVVDASVAGARLVRRGEAGEAGQCDGRAPSMRIEVFLFDR